MLIWSTFDNRFNPAFDPLNMLIWKTFDNRLNPALTQASSFLYSVLQIILLSTAPLYTLYETVQCGYKRVDTTSYRVNACTQAAVQGGV